LLDKVQAEDFSVKIAEKWPELTERLARMSRPAHEIEQALKAAGAPVSYRDLNLSRDEFSNAVRHAREIRNRYTFLDLAADSGALVPEKFVN
jgi:glycerol-1-phosphate dehydrogenase [NAD(P)+]